MTQPEIAQALREIDTLAAEARRILNTGEDRQAVSGHLVAIQLAAQGLLRAVLQDIHSKVDDQLRFIEAHDKQAQANARPIAAAPDLLASSEKLLDTLASPRNTDAPELVVDISELRAAIAKARE